MPNQELATKKDLEEFKEEIIHQFKIVGESLRDEIKIIAEGHQMLSEKIDRNTQEVCVEIDRLDRTTQNLRVDMTHLERKVDGVAGNLAEHRANMEVHRVKLKRG